MRKILGTAEVPRLLGKRAELMDWAAENVAIRPTTDPLEQHLVAVGIAERAGKLAAMEARRLDCEGEGAEASDAYEDLADECDALVAQHLQAIEWERECQELFTETSGS